MTELMQLVRRLDREQEIDPVGIVELIEGVVDLGDRFGVNPNLIVGQLIDAVATQRRQHEISLICEHLRGTACPHRARKAEAAFDGHVHWLRSLLEERLNPSRLNRGGGA